MSAFRPLLTAPARRLEHLSFTCLRAILACVQANSAPTQVAAEEAAAASARVAEEETAAVAAPASEPVAAEEPAAVAAAPEAVAANFAALARHVMQRGNRGLLPAVEELGISLSQLKALGVIDDHGQMSLKAVGEALGLSLPAVSRAVDGLVKRGFLTREECPEDRRSKLVQITPEGSARINEIAELRMSGLVEFVETLSQEELDALAPALELLARRPEIAALVTREGTC